jgi:hypothetical protein
MKIQFKVIEVKPRIFFLDFKNQYHCNMMFLRYQEYYESPNSKFRGKPFEILEFMEWYTKAFGKGAFTYMVDWAGFNIPGKIVAEIWDKGIADRNIYDYEMRGVYRKCLEQYPDGKFYIIGAVGQAFAMRHEIAHGFFYTQPEYKKKMTALVKALKPTLRKKIYRELERIGYTPKVYIDECQAYLSTGFTDAFAITLKKEDQPFVKVYNEYYNQ